MWGDLYELRVDFLTWQETRRWEFQHRDFWDRVRHRKNLPLMLT